MRSFVSLLLLALVLLFTPFRVKASGGTEGTFEYAIDAPWRIEPVIHSAGKVSYGAIPIQIMIDDENVIPFDKEDGKIGDFCDLMINHGVTTRHISPSDLVEIEMTGNLSTDVKTGAWIKR